MKDKAEKIDCPKCLEGYMVKIEGLQQCNNRCGNTLLPAAYEANRQKFLAAKKKRATKNKKPKSQFCSKCASIHMPSTNCILDPLLFLFQADRDGTIIFNLRDLYTTLGFLQQTLRTIELDPKNVAVQIEIHDFHDDEDGYYLESYPKFNKLDTEEFVTEEDQQEA